DRQEIIEIVGDTSGESPHSFHLLRLAKFLFQMLVVGDVNHHAAELAYPAVIISHHADNILEPDRLALRRYRPVSEAVVPPLGDGFTAPLDDMFAILRMDVPDPEIRFLQPLFHGEAQNGLHLMAHKSYPEAWHAHFPNPG